MREIGKYCKAYQLKELRAFTDWREETLRTEDPDGAEQERAHLKLEDNTVVYLQENYCVTADIFKNQNIIFDHITPDWINFCQQVLHFELPKQEENEFDYANEV